MLVEAVQVVLACLVVVLPEAGLLVREHHALRAVGGRLVLPHVPVAVARVAAAARVLEPGVLRGGVVDDEVGDHPHAAVAGRADQLDDVAERAQPGVDAVEVDDVVAVVAVRGGEERHQPQAGDAESVEVVDALDEALDVAAAVAVAVGERLDVQAVDDRVLPPEVGGPGEPHAAPSRSWGRTFAPNASMKASCSCRRGAARSRRSRARRTRRAVRCAGPGRGRCTTGPCTALRRDVLGDGVEHRGRVDVPAGGRREDVAAPLVVGDRLGAVRVGVPAQVHLQVQPAAPARVPVGVDTILRSVLDGLR